MGRNLGVRRTYYNGAQVDRAVTTVKADLAKGRIPWISFKLPHSWADMSTGAGDAWTKDLAVKLSKVDGPVWLALHHEPEGDDDITKWTSMQQRLAPIVRDNAPNVAYTIILTGWNQFYGPSQYSLDSLWPKNTKIDLVGYDPYNFYGAIKDGKEFTAPTDMVNQYFKKMDAWSTANGVPWGIAETGFTDKASVDYPQWIQQTYDAVKQYNGKAFTYFNTSLNSTASWVITTQHKQDLFAAVLRNSPSLRMK
ncbi:cellulase family glycosylhydrolase [Nocardioides aequoreus]|uniref:cellulase family glycosylhydrolase n=1 Tax=Nocardioides aequoreus TaxID=397278 RepID=UPI0004C4400F|nr:cellulase family glycosylhydrolase [Nocardioides aequoreus]